MHSNSLFCLPGIPHSQLRRFRVPSGFFEGLYKEKGEISGIEIDESYSNETKRMISSPSFTFFSKTCSWNSSHSIWNLKVEGEENINKTKREISILNQLDNWECPFSSLIASFHSFTKRFYIFNKYFLVPSIHHFTNFIYFKTNKNIFHVNIDDANHSSTWHTAYLFIFFSYENAKKNYWINIQLNESFHRLLRNNFANCS